MVWMSPDGAPRKNDADSENGREADQPHGYLGGEWLPGSLAERRDARIKAAPHEHGGAGYLGGRRCQGSRASTRYSIT